MAKWLMGLLALSLMLCAPAGAQGLFEEGMFDSDIVKAARAGDDEALEIALLAGESANDRANSGAPAIVVAAENRHLSAVRILVDAGARIDNRSRQDNTTALTVAAGLGEAGMVRALLALGADPDYPGSGYETALLKAARNGHVDVILALIEADADIYATDLTGMSALEIAERARHRFAAEVLREAGAY